MNIEKSNKFIKIWLLIIIVLSFMVSSCGKKPQSNDEEQNQIYTIFPEEMMGIIKNKQIYVTSIGQDAEMIKFQLNALEKQNLFEYTIDSFLESDEVMEGSVVFAFVGCSVKALSESGTTLDSEMERAEKFTQLNREKKILLISIHAGGTLRRGSTSDRFIKEMFSNSYFNIFVETGNFDNYLTDSAKENNVACYQIPSYLSLKETLYKLYGEVE